MPRRMEYHTAMTAASVVVQMPPRMEPRMSTKVNIAGMPPKMALRRSFLGSSVVGHCLPSSVKWARIHTCTHMNRHSMMPGTMPPKNIFATDISAIAPSMTIAAEGGMMGPMMEDAAVTPAAISGL